MHSFQITNWKYLEFDPLTKHTNYWLHENLIHQYYLPYLDSQEVVVYRTLELSSLRMNS